MKTSLSPLENIRRLYSPKCPEIFTQNSWTIRTVDKEVLAATKDVEQLKLHFPCSYGLPRIEFRTQDIFTPQESKKIGVILSGGQAPGGHNVIVGLFDALKQLHHENELYGFLDGLQGLIDKSYRKLDKAIIDPYRNTGGFDMIGSGRGKLETGPQFEQVTKNCQSLGLSGLLIIGGDDSNTNAALLAEYCLARKINLQVIGCPKTIDGDLKNEWIESSFGFDTASKVYSEIIGNIARDALSAKKYWHFIRLMGRSASHITLECALQTHPNLTIIAEEAAAKKQSLSQVVEMICEQVIERSKKGNDFGVVLIPEGLIEFIPEIRKLILELNECVVSAPSIAKKLVTTMAPDALIDCGLSAKSAQIFLNLPYSIREQLTLDRDPHGNVRISQIETERLLILMVIQQLKKCDYEGNFTALSHFLGYEGRCAMPSHFDADYSYSLGYTAAALLANGKTGYMAVLKGLAQEPRTWIAMGIPITALMNIERRQGKNKTVIQKAMVDLEGAAFTVFKKHREQWGSKNAYRYPGPIQYFAPDIVCEQRTQTLVLESRETKSSRQF